MPTYFNQSLSGVAGARDIGFSAGEISRMRRFGTDDRFYPFCTEKQARKGNFPEYGIRTEPPWRFVGFEPANGRLFYRFTRDDISDDPKWDTQKLAVRMAGDDRMQEHWSPDDIAALGADKVAHISTLSDREYGQHMETAIANALHNSTELPEPDTLRAVTAYVRQMVGDYRTLCQDKDIKSMSFDQFGAWLMLHMLNARMTHFPEGGEDADRTDNETVLQMTRQFLTDQAA